MILVEISASITFYPLLTLTVLFFPPSAYHSWHHIIVHLFSTFSARMAESLTSIPFTTRCRSVWHNKDAQYTLVKWKDPRKDLANLLLWITQETLIKYFLWARHYSKNSKYINSFHPLYICRWENWGGGGHVTCQTHTTSSIRTGLNLDNVASEADTHPRLISHCIFIFLMLIEGC